MILFGLAMTAAIVCSVVGDFLVKVASDSVARPDLSTVGGPRGLLRPAAVARVARETGLFQNGKMLLGIALLTVHFVGFMMAMRLAPVTLVVPLMSCTYVATTLLGKMALHERISGLRWSGVVVIMLGVMIVGVSTMGSSARPTNGAGRALYNAVRGADRVLDGVQHANGSKAQP